MNEMVEKESVLTARAQLSDVEKEAIQSKYVIVM
jgi:hypothetical protein